MRPRTALTLCATMLIVACGGAGGTSTSEDTAGTTLAGPDTTMAGSITTTAEGAEPSGDDPCALVTAETVASVFSAASASGEAGIARNCSFTIVDGVAPSVEVFHYGSADDWDGVKGGFEENRGGVTDVPGIGDEAYQPNDVGPYEIVVRAGGVIFSVAVQSGAGGAEVEAALLDLAREIAGG